MEIRHTRGLVVILCCLWSQVALAQGFAIRDLTRIAEEARTAFGSGSTAQAEPRHLFPSCPACAGAPSADLSLGRLTDGIEDRVRSGKTSFGALEAFCAKRNPSCRLSSLPAGRGIGWISVFDLQTGAGATAIILRNGDLLTIEARATDRGSAEDAVRRLTQGVVAKIVGR